MSINVVSGDTGAGKSEFAVNYLIYKNRWKKQNYAVLTNTPFNFPNHNERVKDYRRIHELYLAHGSQKEPLCVFTDEAQKLIPKGGMGDFPTVFLDKLTQGRKYYMDFVTTTQTMANVHIDFRRLVHNWFHVEKLFRFPASEWFFPIIQINRITQYKKVKTLDPADIKWEIVKVKFRFISKLWTKAYYDSFKDVGMEKYLCKILHEKNKWTAKFYDRSLVERGRARF